MLTKKVSTAEKMFIDSTTFSSHVNDHAPFSTHRYVQSLSSLTYFISLVTIRLLHGVCGDSGLVFISLLSSMLARAFEGFASESWMLITG